jgi:hypothetical protein
MDKENKEKDILRALLQEDDIGLFSSNNSKAVSISADDRLVSSFEEINAFIRDAKHPPKEDASSIQERRLYSRLMGILEEPKKAQALLPYDMYNVLGEVASNASDLSMDDLLSSRDGSDLLDDTEKSLFDLKHVPPKETNMPDYVAKRKPCPDFNQYESLFKTCHADLKSGKRTLNTFSRGHQTIVVGQFFILKGVMLYVAEEGKRETRNGNSNARLRCIFENGTESDMLLRSLSAELYKDGRRVSQHLDKAFEAFSGITEEDKEAGHIYVLRSLSNDSNIQSIPNLYKIGFSTTSVEERIKNASQEVTYLLAPVSVVSSYKCYNMNPQTFENLIHKFFGNVRLDIDIHDAQGKRYMPREWFSVPYQVIQETIPLIISGQIVHYRYDAQNESLQLKE